MMKMVESLKIGLQVEWLSDKISACGVTEVEDGSPAGQRDWLYWLHLKIQLPAIFPSNCRNSVPLFSWRTIFHHLQPQTWHGIQSSGSHSTWSVLSDIHNTWSLIFRLSINLKPHLETFTPPKHLKNHLQALSWHQPHTWHESLGSGSHSTCRYVVRQSLHLKPYLKARSQPEDPFPGSYSTEASNLSH